MFNYVKTNWQNGDVITAEKLNNMEDGIANAQDGDKYNFQITITVEESGSVVAITPTVLPTGLEMSDFIGSIVTIIDQENVILRKFPIYNVINTKSDGSMFTLGIIDFRSSLYYNPTNGKLGFSMVDVE